MTSLSIVLRWRLRVAARLCWSVALLLILAQTDGPSVQAAGAVILPAPVTVVPPALAAGNDTVYFFRNSSLPNQANAQAATALQSWQQIYSFSTTEESAYYDPRILPRHATWLCIGPTGYRGGR
jgi:hypothetical protein